ncbi:MAG: DMT family transporter [Gammaproteobacteria bacterium]|nr:DMT family transporter [Gammaproteobacteria bacterium]
MQPVEWALLLALALVWGGSFFFIGVAVREMPPLSLVFVRLASAAITLHMISLFAGQRYALNPRLFGSFAALALITSVMPFSLISWGQTHIASGLASILNATTPLFTLIVAHYLTHDEKMTPARVVGLVLGFSGIVTMIGTDAMQGLGGDVLGQLAVCCAALCYAFGGVIGRRFQRYGLSSLQLATGLFTAATALQLPVALVVDQPWNLAVPGWQAWAAVIALGVISTGVAYIIYFRVLATAGAVNIMLVTFLVPVTAILLGATILNEVLYQKHFAGMALIGLGLIVIDGRVIARLRRKRCDTSY